MKSPSNSVSRLLLCLCTVSLSFPIITSIPAFALEDCEFPAIFNFGDSNSDTGGFAATFSAPTCPYGETFFHMPAGRFSDGRLIIDFLAHNLSLPFLSANLDALGSNFTHGANFAESAATITPQTSIVPNGGFSSPFYLDVQYQQFLEFKNKSQHVRRRGGRPGPNVLAFSGGLFGDLMPNNDSFSKALYTFDIGQNDIAGALFIGNKTIAQVHASIPDIINAHVTGLKKVYSSGARFFWIHNTGPFGCLPYILYNFNVTELDGAACGKAYNQLSQYSNTKLKESIIQLRNQLPLASFIYVDVYSLKYSIFTDPTKYGFKLPLVTCCGYGGEYNYGSGFCGEIITVNGTQMFVGSCENPTTLVSWDGIHYTEAANKFVADQISTGKFSDPSVPLQSACHRS